MPLSKEEKIAKIQQIQASQMPPKEKLNAIEAFLDEQDALDVQAQKDLQKQQSDQAKIDAQVNSDASTKKVEVVGAELITIKGQVGDVGGIGPVGPQGEKGDTGPAGKDSKVKGPKGDKGDTGKDGITHDPSTIALEASKLAQERLTPFIPTITQIETESLTGVKIRDKLENLTGDERLENYAVKDVPKITVSSIAPLEPKFGDIWIQL